MHPYKNLIGNLSEQVYFPRVYLKLVGTHAAAYFLAQVVYWETRMGKEFYRVQEDWVEDGFKEDSLRTAITKCSKYVTVVKKGIPAKNYFSVNWQALYEDIVSATSDPETPATGDGDSPPLSIQEITQILPARAGITIVPDSDTEEKKPKHANAAYEKFLVWAEQRTGRKFVNRVKQYGALKKAQSVGIKSAQLIERWEEMEDKPFYVENGLDWVMVVSSFDRK